MSQQFVAWIEGFLGRRELNLPDGRALYAYRCSQEEFDSLASLLANCPPFYRTANSPIRAFALYASEWWQREYDGGTWAWEPLLESIGWAAVHYPDLYEPVKRAWTWWNVDLVRLPTSTRYLGTFACQGGLPLALLGDTHSSVTRYLRAVLKHIADFRQFVDDPIVLAQDQQRLLRPPTLRRDYVFRLAADLVESVMELQEDAQGDDPLGALNEVRPDWERTMPLALDDQRARDLLSSLLREAVRNQAGPVDEFRVERFLRRTGEGWRLGAKIRLPAMIPSESLARQLKVRTSGLPTRLQIRTCGDGSRVMGLYAQEGDDFLLLRDAQSFAELWDMEAAREIRIEFRAGSVVGEPVLPSRGSALGELPWSFRGTDDCPFIGEGSVASRAPEILVLIPNGSAPEQGQVVTSSGGGGLEESEESTSEPVRVLDRDLWTVREETAIETKTGRCVIRPSSGHTADEEYRLSGSRFYEFECAWPLFRGQPRLRLDRSEQPSRPVPANEVEWRQGGGGWLPGPTGSGLWEARHLQSGELRFYGRMGILPEQLSFSIEPGSDMSQGDFILNDAEAVRVAGSDANTQVSAEPANDAVRVQVKAIDADNPPVRVRLRLHWPGAQELSVEAPFPGQGGRFLLEGSPVNHDLAVDDLYGVRAIALSPHETYEFWVVGELKARDAGKIVRVAHFREKLRKSGVLHELPVSEVRRAIELLLSASSSADAHVTLQIVDLYGMVYESARVSRFLAALECNVQLKLVSLAPVLDGRKTPTFEAYPLIRPGGNPIALEAVGPVVAPYGALLPPSLDCAEPWLIVMRHDDQIRVRPCRVGGSGAPPAHASSPHRKTSSLAEALAIQDVEQRVEGLGVAMEAMLGKEGAARNEAEWSFLTNTILGTEGLPASVFDLFEVLVTKPRFLIQCLFRLESGLRQHLWRLEDELPFSWLLVSREDWWTEAHRTFEQFRERLEGVVDEPERMAREHVTLILSEGAERLPALKTVATDVALRLEGASLSREFVATVQGARNQETPKQIGLRSSLDDWPEGYGRDEWAEELGTFPKKLCQHADEHRARQPIFDTPVAAAWCCFRGRPTERATFLIKRIRAHDPEWFDLAYSATWFRLAHAQNELKDRQ